MVDHGTGLRSEDSQTDALGTTLHGLLIYGTAEDITKALVSAWHNPQKAKDPLLFVSSIFLEPSTIEAYLMGRCFFIKMAYLCFKKITISQKPH